MSAAHRNGLVSRLRRLPLALALAVLLAVLLGLALRPAQAAQLPVAAAKITAVTLTGRCTPTLSAGNGPVTGSQATTVTVAGLGTGCGGRVLALTLFGTGGAALTTANVTLAAGASGSVTVTVPAYTPATVAGAAATIGSWGVPVTWTNTVPPVLPLVGCKVLNDPSKTCTATLTNFESWGGPPPTEYNVYFTVASDSLTKNAEWQITINLADPSLLLLATRMNSNNAVMLAPGWACSSMPLLVLRGQSGPGTQYVGGGSTVVTWLHGTSVPSQSNGTLFACP
ncbi:hypothetical protein SAMN05216410_3138 [Sanguibacter gelidistatuariae]|uniref:Uncharacterized protein n=1 Tax=Sanguibacter gelidistatuariae TaxID=1814289 RepID=A0A1G6TLS1_9MICO|nr:hypothetical protein [Sanguibacter gelidistatuariae]SDD29804.1 hypothetical protein SAMN05216410_3138 [Sanguibacter gelidistatuariae]